ncbi:MAG: type II toxin-antitoxin system prevent-host-death family antitoxin [Deltaproteobacteria bacterium]|nr:type II toxin-antitoxin system prevent-host-death family antitoxin [Deltaproteobacteria bacterium]
MKTTSVSTLKANLSRYLAMARRGTEVQILDRGQPIARLVAPAKSVEDDAWLDELVRGGVLRRGTSDLGWLAAEPSAAPVEAVDLSRALDEEREDRL